MLSIENPPPDPQCPCEISQLKSSNSHERASDNKHQLEVDLSKFSIRDYVLNARSKDIKKNWPFSQKKLQLCLKHGVTNLLPPFQSLDYVRNSSIEKCPVGSITSDRESISNSDGKLSCSSDHPVSVSYTNIGHGHKLSVDCGDINPSESQEDKEFPSTITSHSYSEREKIPTVQSPCLEAETKKFPGSLTEKPVSVVPSSNKSESTIKETVKKCRLIVKLSNVADPRLQEDTGANTSVVSETMASKVCPVCKTFLSSSNTTLNAHIDQCLSGESTIKCTENPTVIKHRIKPRKTRLMVDVYATAKHFTLEDLDRRNGTSWASSNLGFPAPNVEMSVEEKKERATPADDEDINEEVAVYIDSNGTKLRILSKFNDLQSNSNAKDDCRPRKLEKRDKESKFLLSKKRNLIRKHKLMKCAPHGQNSCFLSHDHCHEIDDSEQRNIPPEESCEKEECLTQPLKACDQMKLNNFGMKRQWVGSKRTGLLKKINLEGENQHSDKGVTKDLQVKSHQSSLADPFLKRTSSLSSAVLSDQNPQSPPESSRRQENLSLFSHDGCKDPSTRKRAGFSLSDSQSCHNKKKKHLMLAKCSEKQLRKDGPSVLNRITDPPNCTKTHLPSRSNKRMEMLSPTKNSHSSFISSRSSQHHAYSSGGKKFSSLRNISVDHAFSSRGEKLSSLSKNVSTVSHASIPDRSKKKMSRKCLNRKKPQVHYMSGSDEEALASQSTIVRQHHLVEDLCENSAQLETTGKLFVGKTRVLKIGKKRGAFMICREKETKALKSSQHSPESDSRQAGKKIDSFASDSVPSFISDDMESSGKEVENLDDVVCESIPDMADEGTFMVFSKSLDSAFPVLTGTSDVQGLSQQYLEANKEPSPDKAVLGGEEMFCRDELGKLIITHNVHMVAELDTNEESGNYFVDVDPIPIPGPPGSFLPSPGRMGSEDLHGNSSLTTCRVQSSEDEHELIDMDSSDSPVSAVSGMSNSIAARSYSVSLEKLSLEPDHGVQPETRSSFSRASIDPVVESSSPFEEAMRAGEGKPNLDQSRTDLMFAELSPFRFRNNQPCCCSRKEGALSGAALNNQESQLLQRRTMSSLALPAVEKQMGYFAKRKFESFSSRSEIVSRSKSSSEPEEHVTKSPMGQRPMQFSVNSEVKSPSRDDNESATPVSTPVIRLMGKNLMIVNKDKDMSAETKPAPSSIMKDRAQPLSWSDSSVNLGKIHNEDRSLPHMVSQVPVAADHLQKSSTQTLHFDVSSSNGSVNHSNHKTQLLSPRPSMPMLSNNKYGWSFPSSMGCHEYMSGCNLTPEQLGSRIRVGTTPITDDIEKARASSTTHLRSEDPFSRSRTEIIVIDDTPGSKSGSKATCDEGNMKVGGSTVGISASMRDSRHPNPLYHHLPQGYSFCYGSPIVQNASFQVPPSKGTNAIPDKWNGTPGDSSVLHSNSITASSTSKDHLRSMLYSSPHFS